MGLLDLLGGAITANEEPEKKPAAKKPSATAAKKPSTTSAAKKPSTTAAKKPTTTAAKKPAVASNTGGLNAGALLSALGSAVGGAQASAKPESPSLLTSLLSSFTGGGESKISALADVVIPLLTSKGLLGLFKKSPSKALEEVTGGNLPTDAIKPLIEAIQAKLKK